MVLTLFFIFVIGCCVGSFVNVLFYRMPLGQSIILPRSRCSSCKYQLKWFDNIPIISWFFLRGQCRNCKKNIPLSYPFIEFFTGPSSKSVRVLLINFPISIVNSMNLLTWASRSV